MSKPINRPALLRYSALAGAGALTSPLWSGARPASAAAQSHRFNPADVAADRIVASVRRPRFPGRVFPVTRYGGVGDGVTDCTQAFAAVAELVQPAVPVAGRPLLRVPEHRAGGGRRRGRPAADSRAGRSVHGHQLPGGLAATPDPAPGWGEVILANV
jgi:hypothetical protein